VHACTAIITACADAHALHKCLSLIVQAATNMLLGHFLSMVCSLWLLSVVGEGRGIRFQVGAAGVLEHSGCPMYTRDCGGRYPCARLQRASEGLL
jgi:hypothetical protein